MKKAFQAAHPRLEERHSRGPRPTGLGASLEVARRLEAAVRRFLKLEDSETLPQNLTCKNGYPDLVKYAKRYLRLDAEALRRSLEVLRVIESLEDAGVELPEPKQGVSVREKLVKDCAKTRTGLAGPPAREALGLGAKKPARPGVLVKLDCD